MDEIKGVSTIGLSEIDAYIEANGSVRLRNSFRAAVSDGRFPYRTLGDYLSEPVADRLERLKRLPNVGTRTACEFDELIADLAKASSQVQAGTADNPDRI